MRLEVHPELWTITKVKAEPERRVCCNASTIVDDLGNAVWRNANRFLLIDSATAHILLRILPSAFRQASQERTFSSLLSPPVNDNEPLKPRSVRAFTSCRPQRRCIYIVYTLRRNAE
jgi:hypothetical protein